MPRFPSNYLFCPKIQNSFAYVPSSSALNITGDIDLMAMVQPFSRKNASFQTLIGKYNTTGNQRSYRLCIGTDGTLEFAKSADGSSVSATNSSSTVPQTSESTPLWVRVTWRSSDGLVQFFTAAASGNSEPTSWTQLGIDKSATAGSIFSSTAQVGMGAIGEGTFTYGGQLYRAIIKNGIGGTKVLDADFSSQVGNATSFTESANGAIVTINTSGSLPAKIVGRAQSGTRISTTGMSSALKLDGSAGYMTSPVTPSVNGFCVGFWMKVPYGFNSANNRYVDWESAINTNGFQITSLSGNDKINFGFSNGSGSLGSLSSTTPISATTYTHYVFCYTPSYQAIYVNGVLDSSSSTVRNITAATGQLLSFGKRSYSSAFAAATFKNIVWQNTSTVWTSSQINDLYKSGTVPTGADFSYSLNSGSGTTAVDDTSNGNNGTIVSGTWTSDTPVGYGRVLARSMGSSLYFDGNMSSMGTATGASAYPLVNFSLSFWIKSGIFGASDNVIYGEGSSSTDTPFFAIRAGSSSSSVYGRLLYYSRDDIGTINVNGTNSFVLDNERHFVVFTDANGTLNMYVDGALDRSLTYTRGTLTINRTAIGGLARTGYAVPNKCYLDSVRVHSGILTLAQIQDMYFRDIMPSSGVTLYREWLMSEGSGTTVADTSGNGATMTTVSAYNWTSGQFLNTRSQVV